MREVERMFSKEYFIYLIKSNKYLLLLITLVTLLNVLGNQINGLMILLQGFFTVVLSVAIPMSVFYHVHDKKAADTYFSIPVSRKALLFTGIVFCVLVVYLPFACSIIRYGMSEKNVETILLLTVMLLAAVTVIVFNTLLYLIGNNMIDGAIMIGAYTFMPLAILAILNSFVYSFIAGVRSVEFFMIRYLSPLYLGFYLFDVTSGPDLIDVPSVIALLVILAVSSYLLYRSYVHRPAERAESQSTAFFSFPFVINFYLIICLFLIASFYNRNYSSIIEFLGDYSILYILLFAVFIAAYFVYRRKFYFSYKLPLFYVIVLAVSLFCAQMCIDHKGFGLSDRYKKASGKDYCTVDIWLESENDIYRYVQQNYEEDPIYVEVFIEVGRSDPGIAVDMSDQTADLIDELRKEAIDHFYESRNEDERDHGSLCISNKASYEYYQYYLGEFSDMDMILEFAKDPAVNVTVTTANRQYRLLKDGSLQLLYDYS